MKLTLKENINIGSLTLQHNMLLRAVGLLEGREGGLDTEKRIYLMIAMIDLLVQEDLLALCNEDERDLPTIMIEDIEPFFFTLINENKEYETVYHYLENKILEYCQRVWSEQHSVLGVIDAILTTIASIPEDDKKQVLEDTGKAAAELYEKRTDMLERQSAEVSDKLSKLIQQYQKKDNTTNNIE